jgi:hypothetical protein
MNYQYIGKRIQDLIILLLSDDIFKIMDDRVGKKTSDATKVSLDSLTI